MSSDAPVSFLPLGAIIQRFQVGDLNIVQGFPSADLYTAHNSPYFGETIGRVANRISDAKLASLNGQSYALAANNGPNNLHGGNVGWGKKVWAGPTPVGVRDEISGLGKLTDGGESVRFELTSPDGDEGFPGTVKASVVYTVGKQVEDGKDALVLVAEYEAELVHGAEETVVNMTNHSYFNLTGGPTIEGTVVFLSTNTYLPLSASGIPTSTSTASFPGISPNTPFTLGATEPDIDDCFVASDAADPAAVPIDTRASPLKRLVAAHHPASRVHLEVWSTEPAFQFYTGKDIDVPAVEGAAARGARSGFCVEPSRFVNAANVDEWKGQVLLRKGEKYGTRFVYRAWKE